MPTRLPYSLEPWRDGTNLLKLNPEGFEVEGGMGRSGNHVWGQIQNTIERYYSLKRDQYISFLPMKSKMNKKERKDYNT